MRGKGQLVQRFIRKAVREALLQEIELEAIEIWPTPTAYRRGNWDMVAWEGRAKVNGIVMTLHGWETLTEGVKKNRRLIFIQHAQLQLEICSEEIKP